MKSMRLMACLMLWLFLNMGNGLLNMKVILAAKKNKIYFWLAFFTMPTIENIFLIILTTKMLVPFSEMKIYKLRE